jgi:hypothetical protein
VELDPEIDHIVAGVPSAQGSDLALTVDVVTYRDCE